MKCPEMPQLLGHFFCLLFVVAIERPLHMRICVQQRYTFMQKLHTLGSRIVCPAGTAGPVI